MRVRLRPAQAVWLAAAVLLLTGPRLGLATEVGGGGGGATDCLTTFKAAVTFPTSNPRHVRCTDGDMACDADMAVNGVCTIPLVVCANSTFSANCTLPPGIESVTVDHALDNGDLKFDPDFQALQSRVTSDIIPNPEMPDVCTVASNIRVYIKGPLGNNQCSRGKTKLVKLFTHSEVISGHIYTDVDTIKLQCDPDPTNGCDPMTLFNSTFDRIQRQVFNQSCALSGCHDSESQQGGLLLETGASYNNLVNMNEDCTIIPTPQGCPSNPLAFNDGWKRVDTTVPDVSGVLATSFIVHKIEDSVLYPLPNAGYGARMPRDKPKLHPTLRGIIETWILNGAPMNGWLPETF